MDLSIDSTDVWVNYKIDKNGLLYICFKWQIWFLHALNSIVFLGVTAWK